MKSIQVSAQYPFSVAQTAGRLVDPVLWSDHGSTVDSQGDAHSGWVVTAQAEFDKSQAPERYAHLAPAKVTVNQVLNLGPVRESSTGTYAASVSGLPVKVDADVLVHPEAEQPAHTRITIDARIKSPIPFVGSTLENGIAPEIESLLLKKLEQLRDL